ncbi:DUF2171 domain-containing protein [Falsiroseomonas sp. E2-1-a20]|uniref:DUF2171 domain-containing protein n=1 Tax=Falsiroseomonas sp. E2-1-a20 TaxID=3239300 RepID=UPI003F304D2E
MAGDASGDPMPILGSDGTLVGILDRLEGDRIRLRSSPRGISLPVTAIASVSAAGLRLNIPADRARALAARDG